VTLETRYGGPEGIAKALRVNPEHGLDSENTADLQARKEAFGENRIPVPPQRSLLLLMWDALHDLTLIILLIAGLVSLIIGVAFEEDKAVCSPVVRELPYSAACRAKNQ
jgi:magnesium-transporting ATPase (P-type)